MNFNVLDKAMRDKEIYHRIAVPEGKWPVLRMDGRSFSTLTSDHFSKPFDPGFHAFMVEAAKSLMEQFTGVYAYTESDEISLLLLPESDIFDREVEKMVSVSAAIAASQFTAKYGRPVSFDSRIWVGDSKNDVLDYFRWRMADAERCGLNTYAHYAILGSGASPRKAASMLNRKTNEWKKALIKEKRKIDFDLSVPAWEKRGVGVIWERYDKDGYNPIRKEIVPAVRYRLKVDNDLPRGDDYAAYVESAILQASIRKGK